MRADFEPFHNNAAGYREIDAVRILTVGLINIHKASVQMLMGYCEKLNTTPNEVFQMGTEEYIIPELKVILKHMDLADQRRLVEMARILQTK